MKVKDLLKLLKNVDTEMLIVVDGYEGGYTTPKLSGILTLKENPSYEWYGDYELCSKESKKSIKAFYLARN